MLISQALISILPKSGSRPAVEYLGKSQTFREMADQVGRLSYLLLKEVGAGKRVALIASNSPATILTLFALSNIRGLLIPIHPELSDDDTAQWIYDTKPDVLLVTSDYTPRIQDLIRRRGISIQLIEIDKKRGGEYATSYIAPSDQQPTDKDPILLLRTSGTAGKFKYALFSHNQILAAVAGIRRLYKATGSDRFLTTLNWSNPFAFVHGMLFPFLTGNLMVIDHGHEPSALIDFIHQSKVTRLVGFPDFFQKLLLLCHSRQIPLRGIHSVTVGYGSLSPEFTKIFEMLKTQVLNCYGQTENLWTISMSEYFGQSDTPTQSGVLRPLTGLDYKVIDRNGDEVTGKGPREGQLAVSTPSLMLGYDRLQTKNPRRCACRCRQPGNRCLRSFAPTTAKIHKYQKTRKIAAGAFRGGISRFSSGCQ